MYIFCESFDSPLPFLQPKQVSSPIISRCDCVFSLNFLLFPSPHISILFYFFIFPLHCRFKICWTYREKQTSITQNGKTERWRLQLWKDFPWQMIQKHLSKIKIKIISAAFIVIDFIHLTVSHFAWQIQKNRKPDSWFLIFHGTLIISLTCVEKNNNLLRLLIDSFLERWHIQLVSVQVEMQIYT